jgi:hypothetical protein
MSKRSLAWLRQHTNVEDLLDDGIENNSDSRSLATRDHPAEEPAVVGPARIPSQPSHTQARSEPAQRDFFVAAIGVVIMGCGLGLVLYPMDFIVFHDAARYVSRDVLEHVTAARSRIYGSVGILLGAAALVYALTKPRE